MQTHLLWLIHFYTSLGIPVAALTLYYGAKGEVKTAFFFMFLAILIDATDGFLARRFKVSTALTTFDGSKLDDLVDFLNYVLVPIALAFILKILPMEYLFFGIVPVLASSYGFSQVSAKTEDGFFTGFPSYWNIVVFYLYLFKLPAFINSITFITLSAAILIPIKYITPFKTKPFSRITDNLCLLWGFNITVIFIYLPIPPIWLIFLSCLFPIYYIFLSIYLHFANLV